MPMPDKATIRNLRRAEFYLAKLGITQRSQIREKFDDLQGCNGLGKVLSEAMYNALNGMSREQWNSVFKRVKDNG